MGYNGPDRRTENERLAIVEQRLDDLAIKLNDHLAEEKSQRETLDDTHAKVLVLEQSIQRLEKIPDQIDSLNARIGKYEGVVGGIILTVSCLWAFAKDLLSIVKEWFN